MLFAIFILVFTFIGLILGVFVGTPLLSVTSGEVALTAMYCLIGLVAIDAIFALFTRFVMPKKYFDPFKKRFAVPKWERKFYEKIGIRKWKDKVPEAGKYLVNFSKSEVADMADNEYVYKFMQETCYAEIMHLYGAIFSFAIIFINLRLALLVALPMIVANVLINTLPVMIQRYNRPKLMILYQRNERNQKKEQ
ncbi:MAG: hypothetical protein E7351_03245 [Clostridiales bacterium]|nr:hypothetical protein [Clostridiales bacterium]